MRETMRPTGQMHKAEHLLVRGWHRGFVLHQQSNQRWTDLFEIYLVFETFSRSSIYFYRLL